MEGATKKNPHITQDILNMEFAFIYQDASNISETQDLASILTGHTCLFKAKGFLKLSCINNWFQNFSFENLGVT